MRIWPLSIALARQGHREQANAHLRQALQLDPRKAELHYNLGNALAKLGHVAEAKAAYATALELKPDLAEAHNNWGNVLAIEGRVDEALTHYATAVRLRPDDASARHIIEKFSTYRNDAESPQPPFKRASAHAWTPRARVAVIIPTHRDEVQRFLPECYASLKSQTYPASLFTVFIVHNGSAIAQRQRAVHLAPEARQLVLSHNRGWTGGNNAAIRVAMQERFEYFVMLNVDTVVDPAWLSAFVQAADESPDIHI